MAKIILGIKFAAYVSSSIKLRNIKDWNLSHLQSFAQITFFHQGLLNKKQYGIRCLFFYLKNKA